MTRDAIDGLIQGGAASAAAAALADLYAGSPTAGAAAFVVSRFETIAHALPLMPVKLAVLRSFTIEPLVPQLRARCYLAGLDASVWVGDHGVVAQEMLDPSSRLHGFAPDVVILAMLTRDFAPALWTGEGAPGADAADAAARIGEWIGAFRRHSAASLVVQSFEQPAYAADGVLDVLAADGQRRAIAALNDALSAVATAHRGVYVLDYDALVARHGRIAWADPHKDLAMRVPLRPEAYGWLAEEYLRFLRPLRGRVCKAIAVDLDNTLWGGIVGEDVASGIRIGVDYPGSAFLALQRELKALQRRGILLAICSKNNPDEALAVLRDHPEMLLRPGDFAAMRINWDDKAANLRAIAKELNIGLDAVAFLDDNPVEREWVRSQAPDVHVLDVSDDPVGYVEALRRTPVFERLAISEEDRARTELYRTQRQRAVAAESAGSVDDFLRALSMRAAVDNLAPATLARVAQLTQKTNQFNLTTKRYTEEQVTRFAGSPGAIVRTVRIADRYGDSGLVGVLMARVEGERCEIDTLLLSCRVIGRQIETLMLADLAECARRGGARVLAGWFRPTAKNAPARDVYERHGFVRTAADGDATYWELDLARHAPAAPDWIEVTSAS